MRSKMLLVGLAVSKLLEMGVESVWVADGPSSIIGGLDIEQRVLKIWALIRLCTWACVEVVG